MHKEWRGIIALGTIVGAVLALGAVAEYAVSKTMQSAGHEPLQDVKTTAHYYGWDAYEPGDAKGVVL
jgi:hypothetical protein